VVDYYSRYIEIQKLTALTSAAVINSVKSIFARHGVPETVISDNARYYTSQEFTLFASEYGFKHLTSNPRRPSENGEAERAVQTIKNLLCSSADPYAALLSYRATPLANGYSPSELLMSRKLRTKIPTAEVNLKPRLVDEDGLRAKEHSMKSRMKINFDQRRRAKPLPVLEPGDKVWIKDREEEAVVEKQNSSRSYDVKTESDDTYRRSRVNLNKLPDSSENNTEPNQTKALYQNLPKLENQVLPDNVKRSRYGRIVKPPKRFD